MLSQWSRIMPLALSNFNKKESVTVIDLPAGQPPSEESRLPTVVPLMALQVTCLFELKLPASCKALELRKS